MVNYQAIQVHINNENFNANVHGGSRVNSIELIQFNNLRFAQIIVKTKY